MGALHLFSGNEEFSIKERVGAFLRDLCGEVPEDHPDLEIIRGDNDSEKFYVPFDRLLSSLETPSFLSPRKIIWLKHCAKFDEALAEPSTKKKPSRLDRLSAILKEGLPEDTTLIIDAFGLDRRKAFFKLCEKVCASSGGRFEWFEKTDPKSKGALAALIRRIREYAASRGKRIDDEAASYLADAVGSAVAPLHAEIDKLCAYAGENSVITCEDCRQICSRSADTLAWEFSSALAERNPARALELIPGILDTMIAEKGPSSRPEMAIAASVNNEFKRLLTIRCEGERYHIPQGASADYFYRLFDEHKQTSDSMLFTLHPYRACMMWRNCARFTDRELAQAFQAILEANMAIVTGSDPRLALEQLVLNIAGTPA